MTNELSNLLDSIADLVVAGSSYIPGEAGEIETYLTAKIAEKQVGVTAPVPPLAFLDFVLNLGTASASLIGKDKPEGAKIIKLVNDFAQAVKDGEHSKWVALLPDIISLINDARAFKKA